MKAVSILTLKRMPLYLQHLLEARKLNKEFISATTLASLTGVHMTQVRKDLALTGVQGVPKVGHRVSDLITAIEGFLNWNDVTSAFLVGAGHLGSALLGYQETFASKGIQILAAFDTDPGKAGSKIHEIPVYPLEKFASLTKRLHIHIGILTTPPEVAQEVAQMMANAGILAIWNFTPVTLQLDSSVIVENMDIFASLAVLSRRLSQKLTQKEK